jgi:cell division protein FtsI (penicillin-binding protein 3)
MLRAANSSSEGIADSSPDRLGGMVEMAAEKTPMPAEPPMARVESARTEAPALQPVALKARPSPVMPATPALSSSLAIAAPEPPSVLRPGTAVVDMSGGVVVPSLLGKPLRAVLEIAQESGIEVDIIGSGVAREQSPAAGSRIATGTRVAVRFSR